MIAVPSTKQAVVFLRKFVRTAAKTMVVDRENQKALALLYFGSGPLRNTANSSVVQPSSQHGTDNKDEVLVTGTFCFPKKTTEYSVELFLSIYSYLIFFLKF